MKYSVYDEIVFHYAKVPLGIILLGVILSIVMIQRSKDGRA